MDIMEITRVIGSTGDQAPVSQESAGLAGSTRDAGEPDVRGYVYTTIETYWTVGGAVDAMAACIKAKGKPNLYSRSGWFGITVWTLVCDDRV